MRLGTTWGGLGATFTRGYNFDHHTATDRPDGDSRACVKQRLLYVSSCLILILILC